MRAHVDHLYKGQERVKTYTEVLPQLKLGTPDLLK